MAAGGVSDVTARSPVDRLNSGSGFSNCGTPDRAIGSEGVYGLPVFGDAVCVYDEGFIAAILQDYTGKEFEVIEVDCWATGDRTCRFTADAK